MTRALARRGPAEESPPDASAAPDGAAPEQPRSGRRGNPLASLQVRNYRVYFWGQAVSVAGTWMQNVAFTWFVLQETHSSTLLGISVGVRYGPLLLLALWGGVITDRYNRRHLLIVTQVLSAAVSTLMAVLIWVDLAGIAIVIGFALTLGILNVVASPARQTFVNELVPRNLLLNAISLSSITANVARIIGPTVAAWTIAGVGTGACFALNAASFGAVVLSLLMMDTSKLERVEPVPRAAGQWRESFGYVRRTPDVLWPLLMIAVIGTMAWEFQVSLPIMASDGLDGDATTYGWLFSALGAGAVIGGFVVATNTHVTSWMLVRSALVTGVTLTLAAAAPNVALELVALAAVGFTIISFNSMAKTTLQMNAAPQMRGRVMSLWSMSWQGSGAIGGPLVGWIGEAAGARWSLAAGGVSTLAITLLAGVPVMRLRINTYEDVPVADPDETDDVDV
jgi:MFS family permease